MKSMQIKYVTNLEHVDQIPKDELPVLKKVTEKYRFRANEYYLSLIDWNDPNDPIRKIIIPQKDELIDWGSLDPSNEAKYTIMRGVEHKYNSTALILVNRVCGGICRYCFRKRIFFKDRRDTIIDIDSAYEYISKHKEITNVLLTGGDPLVLPTPKLAKIIKKLREIDHVSIIRIGTKMLSFYPFRITEDPELLELINKYSTPEKRIYFIVHFNHIKEITEPAKKAVDMLLKAGAILANQTPLLRGINDDPFILASLFDELSFIGVPPYYVFQCRPSSGNKIFAVPIEEGYEIFEKARSMVSGLAKRARFVMSHATGKIEIVGLDDKYIFFKYHRAADDRDSGKFMVFKRNPNAYWLDDYLEKVSEKYIEVPSI